MRARPGFSRKALRLYDELGLLHSMDMPSTSLDSLDRGIRATPASIAVQVSALAMPDLMIEIEAWAVCAD